MTQKTSSMRAPYERALILAEQGEPSISTLIVLKHFFFLNRQCRDDEANIVDEFMGKLEKLVKANQEQ